MKEAVSEALKMIDTFASVGANRIHVTKTDINNDVKWGKAYSPDDLRKVLPAMVRVAGSRRNAISLIKPEMSQAMRGQGATSWSGQ